MRFIIWSSRCPRVLLLAGILFAVGEQSIAQNAAIEIEDLVDNERDIILQVTPVNNATPQLLEEERLEQAKGISRVRGGPEASNFRIYYDYQEDLLTPAPTGICFLKVFVIDAREPQSVDGKVHSWYQKFRLSVEGDFVDGPFDLPVRIEGVPQGGNGVGKITLIAHQADPASALRIRDAPPPLHIEVPINKEYQATIGLVNGTRCAILLQQSRAIPTDKTLWKVDPVLETTNMRLAGRGGSGSAQVILQLRPDRPAAFLKSLAPYDSTEPHDKIRLELPFQVAGGGSSMLPDQIFVTFVPGMPLLLLSVVLGSLLAGSLGLLAVSKGRSEIFRSVHGTSAMLLKVFRRLGLAAAIALVVFLVFYHGKGKISFLNLALDPKNCGSAFLIGALVGSNPYFYYRKLLAREERSGAGGPAKTAVGSVLLVTLLTPYMSSAQSFIPVSLAYQERTDELYVLTSPRNEVFKLNLTTRRWSRLTPPKAAGYTTDHCLVQQGTSAWLASVTSQSTNKSSVWNTTVTMVPLGPSNGQVYEREIRGLGRYNSISHDAARSRLIFTDENRGGIYSMAIGSSGLGEEQLVYKNPRLREPISALMVGDELYIGEAGQEAVFALNLVTRKLRTLMTSDIEEPISLAIKQDDSMLFMADAEEAKLTRYNLKLGSSSQFAGSVFFEEPASIVVDRRGRLWIADRGAYAVFEIGADGHLLERHSPR
jgi:hypothetical protein